MTAAVLARGSMRRTLAAAVAVLALALIAVASCSKPPSRPLTELVVRDSTYFDPATGLPFSGRVFHDFGGEEGGRQLEAAMRDGTWEGELTVYHPTGRIRYEGEMSGGARCGVWVENENPVEPESAYQAIREDLESLVVYPECPGGV